LILKEITRYPLGISQTFLTHQELIKQGWCWWYRKYAPGDVVLEGLEKEAREAKKGLWADSHPVPPCICPILPSSSSSEHLGAVSPAEKHLLLARHTKSPTLRSVFSGIFILRVKRSLERSSKSVAKKGR